MRNLCYKVSHQRISRSSSLYTLARKEDLHWLRVTPNPKCKLIEFMHDDFDCFAQLHTYIMGIPPEVINHKLIVDPSY